VVAKPKVHGLSQRTGIERVELGSARPFHTHKARSLQHVEVLRDRLARKRHPILRIEVGTAFEKRLFRALAQAVDDYAAGWVAERFEYAVEFIVNHGGQHAIEVLHLKARSTTAAQ
jgi:hypothetical protein